MTLSETGIRLIHVLHLLQRYVQLVANEFPCYVQTTTRVYIVVHCLHAATSICILQ